MREEVVTRGLALRPVPLIVNAQNCKRPSNTHQHTDVHKRPLEPLLALVDAVDEPPMHADRMTDR